MKKLLSFLLILFLMGQTACINPGSSDTAGVVKVSSDKEADTPSEYISIMALGDNLMHMPVVESGRQADGSYDYSHIFSELQPLIKNADIAVIGQETVFAGKEKGYSGYPFFNSPSDVGVSLVNEGFDVILHASNHTMDKGTDGIEKTLEFWDDYPEIKVLGINKSQKDSELIQIIQKNGASLALLNYTYGTNGLPVPEDKSYLVNLIDEEKIEKDLSLAEKTTDFTIAFMHWGEENQTMPSNAQKELAQKMCNWGADLIIGSHPHVVQAAQWLEGENGNKTLVYYSLGNFVSRQLETKNLLGGIANVTLKVEDEKVSIDDASLMPIVTHYNSGCNKFCVYPLKFFTDELAASHGLRGYGKTMDKKVLKEILYNTFEGFDENLIDY